MLTLVENDIPRPLGWRASFWAKTFDQEWAQQRGPAFKKVKCNHSAGEAADGNA